MPKFKRVRTPRGLHAMEDGKAYPISNSWEKEREGVNELWVQFTKGEEEILSPIYPGGRVTVFWKREPIAKLW